MLKAIKKYAPAVKRVIITSSSAAILDQSSPTKTHSEVDWCPITEEEALQGPANGYRASKTFAVWLTALTSVVWSSANMIVYRKEQHGILSRRKSLLSPSLFSTRRLSSAR